MKTTMTRRYYVGAESISKAMENTGRCPVLKTLDEAISEAKEFVDTDNAFLRKEELERFIEILTDWNKEL